MLNTAVSPSVRVKRSLSGATRSKVKSAHCASSISPSQSSSKRLQISSWGLKRAWQLAAWPGKQAKRPTLQTPDSPVSHGVSGASPAAQSPT